MSTSLVDLIKINAIASDDEVTVSSANRNYQTHTSYIYDFLSDIRLRSLRQHV